MRRGHSIRTLLLKHFLLASLLPTLLLALLLCAISFNMITGQSVQKNSAALQLAATAIENNLDAVSNLAITMPSLGGTSSALSADSLYSLLLSCDTESDLPMPPSRLAGFRMIQNQAQQFYLRLNEYINGIHVVADSGTVLSFGGSFSLQRAYAGDIRTLIAGRELPALIDSGMSAIYAKSNSIVTNVNFTSALTYISRINRLDDSGASLALVVIDMNPGLFESLKSLAATHDAQVYALDAEGDVLYSSDGAAPRGVALTGAETADYDLGTQRIICTYPLSGGSGITVACISGVHPLDIMESTLLTSLIIGLAAIIYAVIMTVRNTRRFSRPIMHLSEVMRSGGELPRTIAPYYDISELRALYLRYNEMLDSVSRYINQKYESELALERMKMKAMEAQMDSHFLYNTLECIYSMALLSGAEDVARVTKSLSDTLRYISRTEGATVAVKQEVMHVQDYVTIQRARLGDDVSCIISVDSSLWERRMLKLTLQPLVENAFKHGLKSGRRPRNVYLSGELRGDTLIFTVRDNGVGIDPDRLRAIIRRMEDDAPASDEGVGLTNINRRLRLYYGAAAALTIESQPMQGTLVTLTLPEGDVK